MAIKQEIWHLSSMILWQSNKYFHVWESEKCSITTQSYQTYPSSQDVSSACCEIREERTKLHTCPQWMQNGRSPAGVNDLKISVWCRCTGGTPGINKGIRPCAGPVCESGKQHVSVSVPNVPRFRVAVISVWPESLTSRQNSSPNARRMRQETTSRWSEQFWACHKTYQRVSHVW